MVKPQVSRYKYLKRNITHDFAQDAVLYITKYNTISASCMTEQSKQEYVKMLLKMRYA